MLEKLASSSKFNFLKNKTTQNFDLVADAVEISFFKENDMYFLVRKRGREVRTNLPLSTELLDLLVQYLIDGVAEKNYSLSEFSSFYENMYEKEVGSSKFILAYQEKEILLALLGSYYQFSIAREKDMIMDYYRISLIMNSEILEACSMLFGIRLRSLK